MTTQPEPPAYRVTNEDTGTYEFTFGHPIRAAEQAARELNAAYRERAHLVALLAAVYPSHIGRTDPGAPDWAVVTLQLPTGQAAWHIAAADEDLFQHVDQESDRAMTWDGHTTDEKYRRIAELTEQLAAAQDADDAGGMRMPATYLVDGQLVDRESYEAWCDEARAAAGIDYDDTAFDEEGNPF